MKERSEHDRREILRRVALGGAGLAAAGTGSRLAAEEKAPENVSAHEYAALGEKLEDEEHRLFGQQGFEKMVDRVAGIEKQLGIYDLAKFTPAV